MKFGQLILRKIVKIVATKCQNFKAKKSGRLSDELLQFMVAQ